MNFITLKTVLKSKKLKFFKKYNFLLTLNFVLYINIIKVNKGNYYDDEKNKRRIN
jgi:hypothetical protein